MTKRCKKNLDVRGKIIARESHGDKTDEGRNKSRKGISL